MHVLFIILFGSAQIALADIGGYMSECYTGGEFETNKTCERRNSSMERFFENNPLKLWVTAHAEYKNTEGTKVEIKFALKLDDHNNYYNPEGKLPILVRVIKKAIHRLPHYYAVLSMPLVLDRVDGQRTLTLPQSISLELSNSWGAEYVEKVEKLEVLLPGVPGMFVLAL